MAQKLALSMVTERKRQRGGGRERDRETDRERNGARSED